MPSKLLGYQSKYSENEEKPKVGDSTKHSTVYLAAEKT